MIKKDKQFLIIITLFFQIILHSKKPALFLLYSFQFSTLKILFFELKLIYLFS